MIDLTKGLNFNAYLQKQHEKYGDVQDKAYENTALSQNAKEKINKLNKTIHAAVFTEGFCPDCIVTIPFIQRMAEENENLKIHLMPRTGFEAFLEEAVGESRIPTVITFDENMNPKGAYVETPKELREKMVGLNNDEKKTLISDYRAGKYNELVEKDLLDIIL
jgi:thiol-disulfide isomerase/thioredoxin